MSRVRTSSAAILIALAAFLGIAQFAFAQVAEGIKIAPAIVEGRADPGETYNFSLKVTNISGSEKTFYLGALDITGLDPDGKPLFSETQQNTGYELSSWVRLPSTSITLGSGESKQVSFSIEVPKTASPGSHFGSVYFDQRPPRLQVTGSGIGLRVGNVISLRINGDVIDDVKLYEFSTDRMVYGSPDVTFSTKLANDGNVLSRPHGIIEVSDMWGSKVATIPVNETGAPIFPKSERSYTAEWHSKTLAFGRYQAFESIVYGEDARRTVTAVTSFWVLPLKLIAMVFGSIFAVLLLMFVLVRVYIKRKLRQMGVVLNNRADVNFYAKRYERSNSRLLLIVVSLLLVAVVLLAVLFVVFA